ncbi:hypothetical protein SDC9_211431 [bioreactor metagenome]|uniref:Uncharacterized protein n=1 Tax=bioreactor metagenome TaxID=1076179 RepID=A0A645JJR4_9ZZZZ
MNECRKRLFEIWDKEYTANCKNESNEECRKSVRFILSRNVLCGNALSLKKVDTDGHDTEDPIIFSEWSLVTGSMIKRRDYRLDEMLDGHTEQTSLFMTDWEYDEETQAFIPKPIKEFPLIDYRRLAEHEQ